jgi:metal-responsive CopG/Arc/MetJ family transcriptional regulator
MEMISVRLPSKLRAKIAAEARRRNVSRSTIVRESLERAFGGPSSRADLAGDVVGAFRIGRRDLSTQQKTAR